MFGVVNASKIVPQILRASEQAASRGLNFGPAAAQFRAMSQMNRSVVSTGLLAYSGVQISNFLIDNFQKNDVKTVVGYMPIEAKKEIPLQKLYGQLLESDSTLLLQRFNEKSGGYDLVQVKDLDSDLEIGKYNVPEPKQGIPVYKGDSDIDVTLVPVSAFSDKQFIGLTTADGNTYCFKPAMSSSKKTIGVALSMQKMQSLPFCDGQVDSVITQNGFI